MRKKLLHYHFPLWVLLSIVAAIVAPLFLVTISVGFTAKLERTLQTELSNQLLENMTRLEGSHYTMQELRTLEEEGTHILICDKQTGDVRYRSVAATNIVNVREDDFSHDAGPSPSIEDETSALLTLIQAHLGDETGHFIISDLQAAQNESEFSLENQELFLCWQNDSLACCLSLPLRSTNEAVKRAILFTQKISLTIWIVFLILFVHATKHISKRYQNIAEMASRMAKLDFSRRCPENLTREMNDLRLSINTMADALEDHVNALRKANERLNIELAERIRQQKIATDLMGNLAHDLKTPIAIVSGYAEGLVEGLAKTPEKQQSYYDCIMLESSHMQEIVTRIIALGRMENGETPITLRNFDLRALLDEIINSFQRELERQDLSLTCIGAGPLMVHTDFDCARQSLLNYVQNAIYHINGGHRIEIRLVDCGNRIRVRVLNSSAPLPMEQTRKIWDKLYRGDPSRQRKHGEMGLGLSIVKSNMERLGHAYGVENAPEFPGICFWLELPKAVRKS